VVNGRRTLALFWRAGCSYCVASRPFYEELSEAVQKSGQFDLVIVTTDDERATADALRADGIVAQRILSVSAEQQRSYKVLGTPTLIALDANGVVERAWVGRLKDSDERAVLQHVSAEEHLASK
jgi:thioredoxin-related protein